MKVVLVCMFFTFAEGSPVELKPGNDVRIETNTVFKEMKSMQECEYYKHQLEMLPPPPPAFAHGYYCEEREE